MSERGRSRPRFPRRSGRSRNQESAIGSASTPPAFPQPSGAASDNLRASVGGCETNGASPTSPGVFGGISPSQSEQSRVGVGDQQRVHAAGISTALRFCEHQSDRARAWSASVRRTPNRRELLSGTELSASLLHSDRRRPRGNVQCGYPHHSGSHELLCRGPERTPLRARGAGMSANDPCGAATRRRSRGRAIETASRGSCPSTPARYPPALRTGRPPPSPALFACGLRRDKPSGVTHSMPGRVRFPSARARPKLASRTRLRCCSRSS
jgi:hypothetical protein